MGNTRRRTYHVQLTAAERQDSQQLVYRGKGLVSSRRRAQILLLGDNNSLSGGLKDSDVATIIGCDTATAERTRKCFVGDGMAATIEREYQESRKPCLLGWGG